MTIKLIIVLAFIITIYILVNKYLININYLEGLCINPNNCGTTELEKVLKYEWQTEPNNPFYISHMVVPQLPEKLSGENIKKTYLNNANIIYSDIENDILNASLLPKHGTTFVYP